MNRVKYLIPNSITASSMLMGLASIYLAAREDFVMAAWLILWGVLLDKLDGTMARLLDACSEFGVQFDSFADFVVFGIAPASLIYFLLSGQAAFQSEPSTIAFFGAVGFFVVASSVRLARFNIDTRADGHDIFYGVPTTFAGATVASAFLTWERYSAADVPGWICLGGLILLGLGMNCSLRLPKLKLRGNPLRKAFVLVNIIAVYTLAALRMAPEYLFCVCAAYLISGVVWGMFYTHDNGDEQEESAVVEHA